MTSHFAHLFSEVTSRNTWQRLRFVGQLSLCSTSFFYGIDVFFVEMVNFCAVYGCGNRSNREEKTPHCIRFFLGSTLVHISRSCIPFPLRKKKGNVRKKERKDSSVQHLWRNTELCGVVFQLCPLTTYLASRFRVDFGEPTVGAHCKLNHTARLPPRAGEGKLHSRRTAWIWSQIVQRTLLRQRTVVPRQHNFT